MALFELFSSFLILLVVTAIIWLCQLPRRSKNYPPGPHRFGFLGSVPNFIFGFELLELGNLWHGLSKKYGSVMSYDLGPVPMVFIGDVQTLKKCFSSNALYGRPTFPLVQLFKEDRGFAMRSDEDSKEISHFTFSHLKQMGMGKSSQGATIEAEVEELVNSLRSKLNSPVSTEYLFNVSSFNVLWKTMSQSRFPLDDPVARTLIQGICSLGSNMFKAGSLIATSKIWKWIPIIFDDVKEVQNVARSLFMNLLQDRKSKFNHDSTMDLDQDLADIFVQKIESTKDVYSPFYGDKGYENAVVTFWELLIGGIETSGSTLSWICLHLALHPEKQKKLQDEIDRLGGRIPNLDDKTQMPFVEATINETLRKSVVHPFGIPRITTQDTKIGEYDVPKNVMVFGNVNDIHNCPRTWGDPENFRPERWLTADEKTVIKHEAFFPFGGGKKQCPGQNLARNTLFLTITRLFREFSVSLNPDEPRPSDRTILGVINPPPHSTLIFSQRRSV